MIDNKTPVLILVYLPQTPQTMDMTQTMDWMVATTKVPGSDSVMGFRIRATALEQSLFLTLLKRNSKYLDASYKPKTLPCEEGFNVSFILPVGSLSFEDVGKLNSNLGCKVCGKKTTSRCSGCQNESYCSAGLFLSSSLTIFMAQPLFGPTTACQKLDWPAHKLACKSLKGATWVDVRLTSIQPGMEHLLKGLGRGMLEQVLVPVNKFDGHGARAPGPIRLDDSEPPENVHGNKLFLCKFQVQPIEVDSPKSMLVYDRQRSFQAYLPKQGMEGAFSTLVDEIRGPRSFLPGLKMRFMRLWSNKTS